MTSLRLTGRIIVWFGVMCVALAIIGAFLFWLVVREWPDLCGNEMISESLSPDGTRRLVVFERNCGATTGFTTQVSVLPAKAPLPNEKGNLFISDTDHGAAPSGPGGGPSIMVTWESDRSVILTHHPKARVGKAEPEAEGVQVRYVAAP